MSWAKFDDRYDDNRKVKRAWKRCPEAVGLHVMAVTYCARHETDGRVDADWICEKLPHTGNRKRVLSALVEGSLFAPVGDGDYIVNDYLDFNESRATKEARREADRARKTRGGRNGTGDGIRAESNGNPSGVQAESGSPVPTPSRPTPVPTLPTSEAKGLDPEISSLCHLLADLIQKRDPKAKVAPDSDGWQTDMDRLVRIDGRSVAEVRKIIEWSQAEPFWQSNILSPSKLRKQFTQLSLKAKDANGKPALANTRDFSRFDKAVGA